MKTYRIARSDVFFFDEAPELIVHLPDFEFAKLKPTTIFISIGGTAIPMRVVGMGNQKGRLAIHLTTDEASLFSGFHDARPDKEIFVSG